MGAEERTDCDSMSRKKTGGAAVSEENIKKFYETIARIISEREQIKVTVKVSRKQEAAEPCLN